MATGAKIGFVPNVAPLAGDFELVQETAATDHVTVTSAGNAAGGAHLVWRTSTGTEQGLITGAGSVVLKDNYKLDFGSLSSGAGDISLYFDGTQMQLVPSTANTALFLGDTTSGLDVRFRSSKAGGGARVIWDASAARLYFRQSVAANKTYLNLLGNTDTSSATVLSSAAHSTGLIKGDMFIAGSSATMLRLGICYSSATQAIAYTRRFELGAASSS